MKPYLLIAFVLFCFIGVCCSHRNDHAGETEICEWPSNKRGAISLTYDDATLNQFRRAMPIMDSLNFKGTFFINTADIPESKFAPRFIGRPLRDIINETAATPTNETNLFERASALRFLDLPDAVDRHNKAGSLYESKKVSESIAVVDEAFAEIRKKKSFIEKRPVLLTGEVITWKEINAYAANGHEFGNHTISHPRLAVLDEPNLLYELEKCKEEIFYQLGQDHIFSAECPFGTENDRVMSYAYKIHPALRNRMPEPFLEEINRWSNMTPAESEKPYVQWQRGPLQKTTVKTMESWVDTLISHDNVWLVLTFHGIDGIGWEAKPSSELREYFRYMKDHENDLWVAPFGTATKYIRERMNSKVEASVVDDKIVVNVKHRLDSSLYNTPLTLKTYMPDAWKKLEVQQGNQLLDYRWLADENGKYVIYAVKPNDGTITISEAE